MPKKPKTTPASKAPEQALPEWVTETPIMLYSLEAFHEQKRQQVQLTLAEYKALKQHLAKIRGSNAPAEVDNA